MESSGPGKHAVEEDARMGAIFTALADPTRRALVRALHGGESSVTELASGFAIGVPAISKHLTVLESAGIISRRRRAQFRHCRLEAGAFERLDEWVSHYTALWEGSLDRLDEYLRQMPTTQDEDE